MRFSTFAAEVPAASSFAEPDGSDPKRSFVLIWKIAALAFTGTAEYLGCGKSFARKAMEKRGHKVLFVCPTNKLAQNRRQNGVALNQFFVQVCLKAAVSLA